MKESCRGARRSIDKRPRWVLDLRGWRRRHVSKATKGEFATATGLSAVAKLGSKMRVWRVGEHSWLCLAAMTCRR